uniref:Uncharacterized protein n=1 Tax=Anolis carolinensis TaxID=28377 RepID=A0A803THC3_ANOCA
MLWIGLFVLYSKINPSPFSVLIDFVFTPSPFLFGLVLSFTMTSEGSSGTKACRSVVVSCPKFRTIINTWSNPSISLT